MTARLPWFKCNPKDFITGTMQFDAEEKGVYAMLMMQMYYHWEPVPNDPVAVARICGCPTRRYNGIIEKLLQHPKLLIRLSDGRLSSPRFEAERAKTIPKKEEKNGDKSAKLSADLFDSKGLAPTELENLRTKDKESISHARGPERPIPGGYEGWKLEPKEIAYAVGKNFDMAKIEAMSEAFRDYHLKLDSRWSDWSAAWRTWVQNDVKFSNERKGKTNGSSQQQQRGGRGFSSIAAGIRARGAGAAGGSTPSGDGPDRYDGDPPDRVARH